MRPSARLLIVGLLGLAFAPVPQPPAVAECPAPYLRDVEHLVLDRGARVTVEGRGFVDGCQDSMSCRVTFGCESCEWDSSPELPMEDVTLRLVQRGRSWDLDVADAGSAANNQWGWVTWTFNVPTDARPGPARLIADDYSQPAAIDIGMTVPRVSS